VAPENDAAAYQSTFRKIVSSLDLKE